MSSGALVVEDGHLPWDAPCQQGGKKILCSTTEKLPCERINGSQIITASIVMIPVGQFLSLHTSISPFTQFAPACTRWLVSHAKTANTSQEPDNEQGGSLLVFPPVIKILLDYRTRYQSPSHARYHIPIGTPSPIHPSASAVSVQGVDHPTLAS